MRVLHARAHLRSAYLNVSPGVSLLKTGPGMSTSLPTRSATSAFLGTSAEAGRPIVRACLSLHSSLQPGNESRAACAAPMVRSFYFLYTGSTYLVTPLTGGPTGGRRSAGNPAADAGTPLGWAAAVSLWRRTRLLDLSLPSPGCSNPCSREISTSSLAMAASCSSIQLSTCSLMQWRRHTCT